MQHQQTAEKPWYKNHIFWLIVIIPFLSVTGSFFTLYLALSSERSGVIDSYYKQGVSPNMQHYQENNVELRIEGGILHARNLPDSPPLSIVFEHPTLSREDRQYSLSAIQPGLYPLPPAALEALYSQKWYFKIEPQHGDGAYWQQRGHFNPKTMNPGTPILFDAR